MLHIGDDVRGFGQHRLEGAVPHGQNQLAALFPQLRAIHAGLLEQLHRGFFQPSFRQGNAQRLHHRSPPFKLISRVSRPTKSTWEIPRLLA